MWYRTADKIHCRHGENGEVIGIDPDEARIKNAQENYKDKQNIKFMVGSSLTGFPHNNEEYYDIYFSNHAFQWLKLDEKKYYLKKAYQCLKPGGLLAIQTVIHEERCLASIFCPLDQVGEEEYKNLVLNEEFDDVETKRSGFTAYFNSYEEFAGWFKATFYHDIKEVNDGNVGDILAERMTREDNGSVKYHFSNVIRITGRKLNSEHYLNRR